MRQFDLKARRAFRLPDGTMMERGQIFSATVRSKVVARNEWFILGLSEQPEDAVIPCQSVCFHEPEESGVSDDKEA